MIPYALFNSKIIFEPFQYKPFFEFFEHIDRDLYIADEVGVGKTIEAGIIISELINGDRENQWIKESLTNVHMPKILILAPAALCAQWKEELESKFMLNVYDAYSTRLGMSRNAQIVVYAQSWQQLAKIEDDDTQYDLLVVDEVHNFRNKFTEDPFLKEGTDSRRYESLKKICARAKRKIFMSATPIFNEKADLQNEIELLTSEYSITASTKSVAKCLDFEPRIESVLVDLNAPERRLYDAISDSGINSLTKSAVYLHGGCSSMPCLAKTLIEGPEKYIKTIFADNEMLEDKYYREIMEWILKWIEEDDYNAIEDFCEETPDIKLRGILKAFLEKEELKEYGEEYLKDKDDVKDSKLEQLDVVVNTKLIPENGYVMKKRHMVIFAHYIATCNHIFEHFRMVCDDDTKIYLATGENTKQEIDQSIEEFKQTCKDDIYDSIMICSDVCLEGKNMQECQVLINYDLPFSSSIMQQRIDRINRNGQKNTPLVFNLLCNVDSDIHTYYKIIFEKIRLINGISGICGINVIRETNEEVQNQVIEEWKNAAINAQKDYENDLSALQNGYLKYLRREISKIKAFGASEGIVAEEIKKAEHYSDEEVLNKMRYILFTAPKEELKSIREEAHSVGKEEVGVKIFGADFSKGSSIRKMSIEYIHGVLKPFIENGIIEYIADTDTYVLNISEIKYDFLQTVIREQVFEYFTNLENPDGDKGQLDMYYDEAHITFATAVYKEIGTAEDINGKSLGVFEEIVGDTFDDMYISLTPLCDVLKQCI